MAARVPAVVEPPVPQAAAAEPLGEHADAEASAPSVHLAVQASPRARQARRSPRRKNSAGLALLIAGASAALLLTTVIAAFLLLGRAPSPDVDQPPPVAAAVESEDVGEPEAALQTAAVPLPQIEPVDDVTVAADDVLLVAVQAADVADPARTLHYRLTPDAPRGARIDPRSGTLSWQPGLTDAGSTHRFTISVAAADGPPAEIAFDVTVVEPQSPLLRLTAQLQAGGLPVEDAGFQLDPLFDRACRVLMVGDRPLPVAEYSDESEADALLAAAESHWNRLQGERGEVLRIYRRDGMFTYSVGSVPELDEPLLAMLGEPVMTVKPSGLAAVRSDLPRVEFTDSSLPETGSLPQFSSGDFSLSGLTEDDVDELLELYDSRSLFSVKEYPTVRRLFADRFERLHADEIQTAWGEETETVQQWLEENRVLKEELFLAIDPAVDNVVSALQIFKELKDRFPDRIVPYGNLAIAIAVTWDQPRAMYHYGQHQRRTRAVMPDGLTGAADNFEYFLKTEQLMQGRGQWLPWEFLVHVVDHQTPMDERQWALRNYLASRTMIGKCYQDVPYDQLMLETRSAQARMNDRAYTLENLRTYGGVCALQADFAARVAKSLAVPAAYVGGESAYGELHAWVMWVELKSVTPKSIAFSLESHGRYRGDRYYVGALRDPKSGREMTDRQLELRLHTVGMDPIAKRHADLLMAAYASLNEKRSWAVNEQFSYMTRTINLCPGNVQAWTALAGMASDETVREKHRRQMTGVLNQLFNNFANFPDFTWTIFDDLIAFEERLKERIQLYERLVLLYQSAQRPDLASEARLRLTDLLVEDGREIEAVDGLAATIHIFVDEGRYVPRMLDRIEAICEDLDGATPHLLRFYHSFLPNIPQMRGNRPSNYCMQMYQRAVALFRQHGELASAQAYEMQLAQLRTR